MLDKSPMEISYRSITIETCPGVYVPAEDTFLVVDHASVGSTMLEIGAGSGLISIYYAKMGKEVSSCDINEAAVACTRSNAEKNGVHVNAFVSNLFSEVPGKYDTIIFNPPYLPTADEIEGAIQWNGGKDGFVVVRPFLDSADRFLNPGGNIFIILSSLTDYHVLEREYVKYFFQEVAAQSFFFETILLFSITKRS